MQATIVGKRDDDSPAYEVLQHLTQNVIANDTSEDKMSDEQLVKFIAGQLK